MYELLKAIQTHYANSILPAYFGGLFVGLAPQDETQDYATVNAVTSLHDQAMNETQVWQTTVLQFSLFTWDTSPASLLQTAELWCNVFDDAPLTVSGGAVVWVTRTAGPIPVVDPDGGWQVTIDYSISVDEV